MSVLQWSAPLTMKHVRSKRWYLIAGVLTAAGIAGSILTGNWTFGLGLALAAGLVYLLRNVTPANHTIVIRRDGFMLDDTFTSWLDCKDFWIIRVPTHTELRIGKKVGFEREVSILTGTVDTNDIRSTLSTFLPERSDAREHWSEALIRILKL